jgi:hypothetical protein
MPTDLAVNFYADQTSRLANRRRYRITSATIRPADIFVMDEQLVEIRKPTHPSEPEEPARRTPSDGVDQA